MASGPFSNKNKPVIGVTGNAKRWSPSWWNIRLAVWLAGGRAVRISTRHSAPSKPLAGLIISGGDDIHPSLYGEEEMPKAHYDPDRDALEQDQIKLAMREHLPMLGICRGYQLMNVVAGGQLHVDIRSMRSQTSNRGTIFARKTALVEPKSSLYELFKTSQLRINSLHHQAVLSVGRGYGVVAKDLDGFVQAVEHENSRWIGVQWHPEYLWYRPKHLSLFKWLVRQCNQSRHN